MRKPPRGPKPFPRGKIAGPAERGSPNRLNGNTRWRPNWLRRPSPSARSKRETPSSSTKKWAGAAAQGFHPERLGEQVKSLLRGARLKHALERVNARTATPEVRAAGHRPQVARKRVSEERANSRRVSNPPSPYRQPPRPAVEKGADRGLALAKSAGRGPLGDRLVHDLPDDELYALLLSSLAASLLAVRATRIFLGSLEYLALATSAFLRSFTISSADSA